MKYRIKALILLFISFLVALIFVKSDWLKDKGVQQDWYQLIYDENVTIKEMKGVLKVLRIKDQIHVGTNAPPVPKESESMLKNYAQSIRLEKLSDDEVRDLFCIEVRNKLTSEAIDISRRARVTHPQLYEGYIRYIVIFEDGDFKILFPCSASTPDAPLQSSLNGTALRWDKDQWRMWPDSNEARLLTLTKHIKITRPFELDKLIIK